MQSWWSLFFVIFSMMALLLLAANGDEASSFRPEEEVENDRILPFERDRDGGIEGTETTSLPRQSASAGGSRCSSPTKERIHRREKQSSAEEEEKMKQKARLLSLDESDESGDESDSDDDSTTSSSVLPLGTPTAPTTTDQTKTESTESTATTASTASSSPNLLVIVLDQLRYDALGHVQRKMKRYDDKVTIRTPNIDRLASRGAAFETAYCVAPSCAPSRITLKTGATLQRAAIKGNRMIKTRDYKIMPMVERKVAALRTYEQVLADECGYAVESLGKWHLPLELYYSRKNKKQRVIRYNYHDFKEDKPKFYPSQVFKPFYQSSLKFLLSKDKVDACKKPKKGQQKNYYSNCWYDPIRLDPRYGKPTNTKLAENNGFEKWQTGNSNVCGRDSLPKEYTRTAVLAQMAIKSLERLAQNASKAPFALSVNFASPHPPSVCTGAFLDYYWERRNKLFTPPSIRDTMQNSAYKGENGRKRLAKNGYNNQNRIAELTAVYYGLVAEVDSYVGQIMDKLEAMGQSSSTLVVFTSDHGEQLGAHSMLGKGIMLEESARVPLILSFPGRIPMGKNIDDPSSHLDIFSTILDYLGFSRLDKSDGVSLRRYIDQTSYNDKYDERIAVVEMDRRIPRSAKELSGKLGDAPNFMIRRGEYKLLLPKNENSKVLDMLYNIQKDPFEMHNLLGKKGKTAGDVIIGKAEWLKCLLVEWMQRNDGRQQYYSNNKYNLSQGRGDIREIRNRRTWKRLDFWISHSGIIPFGSPSYLAEEKVFMRSEYLYVGRTTRGVLRIKDVTITGSDARYFNVARTQASISQNGWLRIRITFQSTSLVPIDSLDAHVRIDSNVNGVTEIKIVGENYENDE